MGRKLVSEFAGFDVSYLSVYVKSVIRSHAESGLFAPRSVLRRRGSPWVWRSRLSGRAPNSSRQPVPMRTVDRMKMSRSRRSRPSCEPPRDGGDPRAEPQALCSPAGTLLGARSTHHLRSSHARHDRIRRGRARSLYIVRDTETSGSGTLGAALLIPPTGDGIAFDLARLCSVAVCTELSDRV